MLLHTMVLACLVFTFKINGHYRRITSNEKKIEIKHQSGLKSITSYIDCLKVLTRLSFVIVLLYCLSCQLLLYYIDIPNLIKKNAIFLLEYYIYMYAFLLLV